jgi:hypothetical protein
VVTSLPPVYLAVINVPGYLPVSDPEWSDSAQGAWGYLLGERMAWEEAAPDDTGEFSGTVLALQYLASEDHLPGSPHEDWPTDGDGCGVIYGPTPGYDGYHDLGLAYSVRRIDHLAAPHRAGYMVGCVACASRCYCEGRNDRRECLYLGEHS